MRRRSFNTQPPEGGWVDDVPDYLLPFYVSTHSRPKAAGSMALPCHLRALPFQHTAARRRLVLGAKHFKSDIRVSTHSRPKAAGITRCDLAHDFFVSTHSRPKAAGVGDVDWAATHDVSTHSRPKAAGEVQQYLLGVAVVSTHSRPKAAGCGAVFQTRRDARFNTQPPEGGWAEKYGEQR